MKIHLRLFGIIAIVAIIGFSMAACDMDDPDTSTEGRLTITGLSSYNGWEIRAYDEGCFDNGELSFTATNNDIDPNSSVISGGSVTFYVWAHGFGHKSIKGYTGNDQNVTVDVSLNEIDGERWVRGTVTVNFSNGKGSGQFVRGQE